MSHGYGRSSETGKVDKEGYFQQGKFISPKGKPVDLPESDDDEIPSDRQFDEIAFDDYLLSNKRRKGNKDESEASIFK